MKTKTLLFSLVAGAMICFSTTSYGQYHSSGSSSSGSSGSSGSGDGFDGQNVIGAGVGFLGGFGGLSVGGYTISSSPNIILMYDHGLNEHWGVGVQFGYQTTTWTDNFSDYVYNSTTQTYTAGTYSESWKWTVISFMIRGTYHFTVNEKFDPYVGIGLGYNSIGSSYSNTDPNYGTSGSLYTVPTYSYSGAAFGGFVGCHYYFTNHIGAWAQLGYMGYASGFVSLGIAFKL